MAMETKHFYRFAYQLPKTNGRHPTIHTLRDGDAFIELSAALYRRGLSFKGTLLNLPAKNRHDGSRALMKRLGPTDLIVVTTRPPLNDNPKQIRRALRPGKTWLESRIHKRLGPCFTTCKRSEIRLSPHLAELLAPEVADRADICFYQYWSPKRLSNAEMHCLRSLRQSKTHPPAKGARSAVYLIRRQIWEDGPWLLCAFGVGGGESLIWAHLLATRYEHYLREDGPLFVMGELHLQPLPPRPFTLSFVDDWKLDVLLEHRAQNGS